MRNLFLDYETWSSVNIKRGTDVYLEHAKPLIFTWAFDDEPVRALEFGEEALLPDYIEDAMRDPSITKVAHNSFFDRLVTLRLLLIETDINQWHDTMAQASIHSLPGGLDALCTILGVPVDIAKIKDGKELIRKFCCGKTPPTPQTKREDPDWLRFVDYAKHDISAMRECYKRMPNWNYKGFEKRVWVVDQVINNNGFAIDRKLAENAVAALKAEKKKLNQETFQLTNEQVHSANQRDVLLDYLAEQGVVLKDMKAPTIKEALKDERIDDATREILMIRLQSAQASPSKYVRVLECTGEDDRLRGTMQYAGANRTGRWAGRAFQPHNLLRPNMKKADIRAFIDLLRNGYHEGAKLFANMNTGCGNATRGVIVAPDGKVLQGADFSSIEGRGNAWISGEDWKIAAFQDPSKDMYCLIYERAFNLPEGSVAHEGDDRRQQGKVMELALSYQGGVGAFLNMAFAYNMDLNKLATMVPITQRAGENYDFAIKNHRDYGLDPKIWMACETLKLGYRAGNPAITAMWTKVEEAARRAIILKEAVWVGRLEFTANDEWLRIQLPSGRYLCYALPEIHGDGKISYMAWRNRRWRRTSTYGGKLIENIVQALSRDILAAALVRLFDAGYKLVLHVHDEGVAEVDAGSVPLSKFVEIFTIVPDWATGFPIAAKGFQLTRYEKT